MLSYFLSAPGIYLLICFIIIAMFVVYRKRNWFKKEFARWRVTEVNVGPVKLSRQQDTEREEKIGIEIGKGVELTGTTFENVVGGNRIKSSQMPHISSKVGGIKIGNNVKIKKTKMKKLTGGNEIKRDQS